MKVDYDSEADASAIDLIEVDRWDFGDEIDARPTCNGRDARWPAA